MPIGDTFPSEWREFEDPETGRQVRQLTAGRHNNYPLYYFIPSITPDGRYLVFHSERTGWVQLFRLDLQTGEIVQLTDGRTLDSGWAIWCQPHLRGISNHLSALNGVRQEAYYFQDCQLRCVHLESLKDRLILEFPDRISVGQTGFSLDGRHFAFIHADRQFFAGRICERESLINMGQFGWGEHHDEWRNRTPTTISVIDTETCALTDVIELDFHVHHVFFADDQRLLVNHVKGDSGMWIVSLDGSGRRNLRPRDDHGVTCHQTITERGIYYESNTHENGRRTVYTGRYDLEKDSFEEIEFPNVGYVHTGSDPAGRFLFCENQAEDVHQLLSLHFPRDPDRFQSRLLRTLPPIPFGQRYHAHPFLSPDRSRIVYTELVDGYSQVCALDVADLVDLDEYWI